MELPEEEKALLIDAVSNIHDGLGLLSQQLDTALNSLEPINEECHSCYIHILVSLDLREH